MMELLLQRLAESEPVQPLGVLGNRTLSDEHLSALRRLENYDLSPVRARNLKEGTIPEPLLDEAIREFRRYISLYLLHGTSQSITMFSEDVDEVWHVCILHTRLYEDFCQSVLGSYLHHQPFLNGDPYAKQSWKDFEDKYTYLYGPLPVIWHLKRLPPPWGPAWMRAIQRWLHPTGRVRKSKGTGDGGCGCGSCGGGGNCGGCA